MKTTFIMVVLVEIPIVHDHLDYRFKIRRKRETYEEGNHFLVFFHVTPNQYHILYNKSWVLEVMVVTRDFTKL